VNFRDYEGHDEVEMEEVGKREGEGGREGAADMADGVD
jgi:hypothetical protein